MTREIVTVDYGSIAAAYAEHREIHPEVFRSLIRGGVVKPDRDVVEVGCGTGNYILALVEAMDCHGWGVDPDDEMLRIARQRTRRVGFSQGSAEALRLPSTSFDLVFSVDVIHNVADLDAAFQEAARVLRPRGKVATVTDSEAVIRARLPLTAYFPETAAVDLRRYPRIASIARSMASAGFVEFDEQTVEFPYELHTAAPYREKVFSGLRLISEAAFQRGLRRLEEDLAKGPIPCVSRYTLVWGTKRARVSATLR
jgi:ubiquinone/menaquinone biosynthesis C-methylase UbiE